MGVCSVRGWVDWYWLSKAVCGEEIGDSLVMSVKRPGKGYFHIYCLMTPTAGLEEGVLRISRRVSKRPVTVTMGPGWESD